ncbi:MAG: hypothetical protein PXX73_05285 [Sideroxydans sp.]|nr:hypothetical protein [Sideroxydans sp.]
MSELFDEKIIDALADKLGDWKSDEKLAGLYNWPIEKTLQAMPAGFEYLEDKVNSAVNKNTFEKTLCLRREIAAIEVLSFPLSRWIVENWGGIAGKNEASLKACIDKAESGDFDFNRIASWSKHMAFKHPDLYAIYDARVVYSLNWLLFKAGAQKYFPAPSGRNSVMELLDYRILLFIKHHTVDGVKQQLKDDIDAREIAGTKSYLSNKLKQKLFIELKDAFDEYNKLLARLAEKLYPKEAMSLSRTKVEMMLFSVIPPQISHRHK